VIGTEDSRLLILDPTATRVSTSVTLGAPAAFLAVAGTLNAGYRVTAAARDGKLYTIKAGALSSSVIQLDAQAVGVVSGCDWRHIVLLLCLDSLHCSLVVSVSGGLFAPLLPWAAPLPLAFPRCCSSSCSATVNVHNVLNVYGGDGAVCCRCA
jgi:hypothetical protein